MPNLILRESMITTEIERIKNKYILILSSTHFLKIIVILFCHYDNGSIANCEWGYYLFRYDLAANLRMF